MPEADKNQRHLDKRNISFELVRSLTIETPHAIVVGDVDGDTNLDIVAVNTNINRVSVILGTGTNSIGSPSYFSAGQGPFSVALVDVNKDNNLDIITANYGSSHGETSSSSSNAVSVLLGNGASAFNEASYFKVGINPTSVALGDFNKDGNLDIVTADYGSYRTDFSTISVILGDGTGSFRLARNFDVGAYPIWVVVGDFNKDDNLDVITANSGEGSISVLSGNGTGGFEEAKSFTVGASPVFVAVADFDGDSNLDIVTANSMSNSISVLLGDGTGNFGEANNFATGAKPVSVAVADFDDDGNLDIVTANTVSNSISLLLGTGTGAFKKASNFAVGNAPNSVIAADFNKDGKVDILTAVSSGISALINQSASSSISVSENLTASSEASLALSPAATNLNLTIPVSIVTKATPTHFPLKTPKLSSINSGEPSTIPMTSGTLTLLMMAPVGGLLLLMLVFGAFFYRRYQNKIEKNEQYKDLPMLPMKQKSNDSKIELLVDNEEYRSEIDAEMQGETTETDCQEQEIPEQFAKKQQFFKRSQTEHETATVQSTNCVIS